MIKKILRIYLVNHFIGDFATQFIALVKKTLMMNGLWSFKRSFDFILAGLGLVVSSPLWVFIAMAIIIEDGFPVLIRQKRIGKMGRLFISYKFRSMKKNALYETVNIQAFENDPRVTQVGKVIRRCAMDELPQLINILLGDMSFVGPRALLPTEAEVHRNMNGGTPDITQIPGYNQRIAITPGLTGIAQIYAPRDILRHHKFKYDLFYARKHSFWLDCRLIVLSFLITFSSRWEKRGMKLWILRRPSWKVKMSLHQGTEKRNKFTYVVTWIPLITYISILVILANVIFTNENTLHIIDYFTAVFQPPVAYSTLCMWVGKTRDFSHIFIYAIFAALLFKALKRTWKLSFPRLCIMTVLIGLIFSTSDELLQSLLLKRSASVTDWCIDILGMGLWMISSSLHHVWHNKVDQ